LKKTDRQTKAKNKREGVITSENLKSGREEVQRERPKDADQGKKKTRYSLTEEGKKRD